MSRKLPRSFFWIDQSLIRNGTWLKLSAEARLAYIAIAASCDRHGVSIWSRSKLMALSACKDPDDWEPRMGELMSHQLIEPLSEHCPPAIRLIELQVESPEATEPSPHRPEPPRLPASGTAAPQIATPPIVVHTHTTIHLGITPREGNTAHAAPRSSD